MFTINSDYTRFYSGCSPIIKQKDMIDYEKTKAGKTIEVKTGILAAVRLSNINLIHMRDRMDAKGKLATTRPILQSEALSLFKGNISRILKQTFNSECINRIKGISTYSVSLHEDWSTLNDVSMHWDDTRFNYHYIADARDCIKTAFANITPEDILEQAIAAMNQISSEVKTLISKVNYEPSIHNINFDSITDIKFNVK